MSSSEGKVYLVGAGPGDPRLITVRGAELLAAADLVLYDGLVNPLLLELASCECERTARTRSGGHAVVPQGNINARLIAEARSGRTIVRLKGGDPYIFGRGSEEVSALRAAGIPFEVIPGITAATAAGVYAGFSYTHRDISSAVAFVTGHETPERDVAHVDYDALARFPGTLVFYMGLARIYQICSRLIASGMSAETPAAVISHASLPTQNIIVASLNDLSDKADQAGIKAPSLIVVGETVGKRGEPSWFESLPLFGLRIGITRSRHQAADVTADIVRLGGEPVWIPMIDVLAPIGDERHKISDVLGRLEYFDWLVFTSANGVRSFLQQLWNDGRDLRCLSGLRIAAVGSATAAEIRNWSLRPDRTSEGSGAESLAAALTPEISGRRVLWPSADRARNTLRKYLEAAGATVEQLTVYRSVDADLSESVVQQLRSEPLDWIGLSSPAIARRAATLLPELTASNSPTRVVSISPLTTEAAKTSGLQVHAESETASWSAMLATITDARDNRGK